MVSKTELFEEVMFTYPARIGELLAIKVADVFDGKLIISNGKLAISDMEIRGPKRIINLTEELSKKLKDYVRQNNLSPTERLFQFNTIEAQKIGRDFSKKNGFRTYPGFT
jgi:integrase